MAEIMFETFGVKGLFIGEQAALALYSQIAGANSTAMGGNNLKQEDMTGIVIDSGDGVTHVLPVADGQIISSCVKHIPLAGRDITKYTMMQLRERKENLPPEDALAIAAAVKEKYGYVCKDIV